MIRVSSRRFRVLLLVALLVLSWCISLAVFAAPVSASPSGSYVWPVKGRILTEFRKPTGPYGKGGHQGVDIAAETGTTVRASGCGRVVWTGELPRGRYVSISHTGGVKTTYLDLFDICVKPGDTVKKGQAIGTVNGSRDSSSPVSHLHFSASMNGTPVDPMMLIDGIDSGSYIRLCPVSDEAHSPSPGVVPDGSDKGILSGIFDWIGEAGSYTWGLVREGFGAVSTGLGYIPGTLSTLGHIVWDAHAGIWRDYVFPALKSVGTAVANAARWVWNNPYVQALTAGILAAIAVVAIVVAGAVALCASVVVTVVAAVVAAVACIGVAVYYAVASGGDINFTECFWQSFCGGIIAGGLCLSAGSLSGAFSAGFAKLGIAGIAKAAITNGAFSAVFEGASGYLLNGEISARGILVAFGIGALSGAIGAALKAGIAPRKIMEILRISFESIETRVVAWCGAFVVGIREAVRSVSIIIVSVKEIALSVAGKVTYLLYSGSFGAAVNVLACALSGKEISFDSVLASFITGVAMGGLALSFGTEGLRGLLAKVAFFKEGFGKQVGNMLAKVLQKTISKSLKSGLKSGFRKLRGKEV